MAIYQGRGNLIDQGVLLAYADAKGSMLDGVKDFGWKVQQAQHNRMELEYKRARMAQIQAEMSPAILEAKMLDLRAKGMAAQIEIETMTQAQADKNAAAPFINDKPRMAEFTRASDSAGLMGDIEPFADYVVGVQSDDRWSKNNTVAQLIGSKEAAVINANRDRKFLVTQPDGKTFIADAGQAVAEAKRAAATKRKDPDAPVASVRAVSLAELEEREEARRLKLKAETDFDKLADTYLEDTLKNNRLQVEIAAGKYRRRGAADDLPQLPGNLEWNDQE